MTRFLGASSVGWLATVAAIALLSSACGPPDRPATRTAANEHRRGERSWRDRAMSAYLHGDIRTARTAATKALAENPRDDAAREVGARAGLAERDAPGVIELLRGVHHPILVRLRARAHVVNDDFAAAAHDLESVEREQPEDAWAAAVLPVVREGAGKHPYQLGGQERVVLPLLADKPLPLVEMSVDGRTINALVATSAHFMVVDDGVRPSGGIVNRVAFGAMTVDNVPVLSRDLGPIGDQLSIPVGAVIGVEMLLRLHATIDGRQHQLVLRRSGTEAGARGAPVPYLTFDGSFLAVPVLLTDEAGGWFAVDTAGLFPIALSDEAVRALGRNPASLPRAPGAPSEDIRVLQLETIRIGGAAVEGVPAVTGLFPRGLPRAAGGPIGGIVGGQLLGQLKMSFQPDQHRLVLE